jgi:hypothetical protein
MSVIIKTVLLELIWSLKVGHESSSTGAQYVVLHKLIEWKNDKTPWIISANFRFGPAFLHKML